MMPMGSVAREADVDVLREQVGEVFAEHIPHPVDELTIRHCREVRAIASQRVHGLFVGENIGKVRCREHPAEGLGDLLGQLGTVVARAGNKVGHTRRIAKEGVVDVFVGHAGRTVAEHA